MMAEFEDLYELLGHPKITAMLGKKGSGKTALTMRIAEDFHEHGHRVILITRVHIKPSLLPDWIDQQDPNNPVLKKDSLVIFDDAKLIFPSKRHYSQFSLMFEYMLNVSRHHRISYVIDFQMSSDVILDILRKSDNIIVKDPGKSARKLDRVFIHTVVEDAAKEFDKLVKKRENLKKYFYIEKQDDRFSGVIGPVSLPEFWSDELSTYLSRLNVAPLTV